ncbi:hypothetical protein [Kitasatospora camelliae]|uniref:MFS transporter n=1 Tax=Kitasatospora camelliae TaxID=3156397 RepID=A0AAU8JWU1_9ACTN
MVGLVAGERGGGGAVPSGALAAGLPLGWIVGAALLAGIGAAVCETLYTTSTQQHVPAEALARVSAFTTLGAFVLGPLGLALAGPVAEQGGASRVLGYGALWQVAACAAVLALPSVRRLGRPAPGVRDADRPRAGQEVPPEVHRGVHQEVHQEAS